MPNSYKKKNTKVLEKEVGDNQVALSFHTSRPKNDAAAAAASFFFFLFCCVFIYIRETTLYVPAGTFFDSL